MRDMTPALRTISRRRAIALSAGAVGAPLIFAACGGEDDKGDATPSATTRPGETPKPHTPTGTVRLSLSTLGTESLLPPDGLGSDRVTWHHLYDYLLYVDPASLELKPGLAEKWEATPDFSKYTFTLRDGVKFHNGDALTSADVKFTLELMVAPEARNPASPFLRDWIESVEAPDPKTVVINLRKPTFLLAEELSVTSHAPIMPKTYIESVGVAAARERPIGSGPFKFVGRQVGQYVELEALDSHWRQVPYFKTARLSLVREASTRIAQLQAGEADIIDIEPAQKPEVEGAGLSIKRVENTFGLAFLLFGQYDPSRPEYDRNNPLLRKEVREALSISIDRDAMVRQIWRNEAKVTGAYPAIIGQKEYEDSLAKYPYDVARAKSLLNTAGYPNGFELKLAHSGVASIPGMADAIQSAGTYWQALGIRSTLQTYESAGFVADARARKLSGVIANVGRSWKTRDTLYFMNVHFSKAGTIGGCEDPGLEAIRVRATGETNPSKYYDVLKEANRYIRDNTLVIPLVHANFLFGVGKKVDPNWPAIEGDLQFHNLEYVRPKSG